MTSIINIEKISLVSTNQNKTTITADSNLSTDTNLTLPDTVGTSGNILRTDGTGITSWIPNTGTSYIYGEVYMIPNPASTVDSYLGYTDYSINTTYNEVIPSSNSLNYSLAYSNSGDITKDAGAGCRLTYNGTNSRMFEITVYYATYSDDPFWSGGIPNITPTDQYVTIYRKNGPTFVQIPNTEMYVPKCRSTVYINFYTLVNPGDIFAMYSKNSTGSTTMYISTMRMFMRSL
jgi:hypothetical protein